MPEVREVSQQALLVQIVVAQATGVPLAALYGAARGSVRESFARQMAMYLCRLVFAMTLGDIAFAFQRDRSTAAHAIRRIEEAREHPEFDRRLNFVEAALRRNGGLHG
jgi:chromosomal replication initiation ATPase DnaA